MFNRYNKITVTAGCHFVKSLPHPSSAKPTMVSISKSIYKCLQVCQMWRFYHKMQNVYGYLVYAAPLYCAESTENVVVYKCTCACRPQRKVTDLHKVTLGYTRIDRITCFPLHRVLADFIINGPCISKEPYFSELSCRRRKVGQITSETYGIF